MEATGESCAGIIVTARWKNITQSLVIYIIRVGNTGEGWLVNLLMSTSNILNEVDFTYQIDSIKDLNFTNLKKWGMHTKINKNDPFSQPFEEKCISEVVRIGTSVVIFHLSKLWKVKFFILWDVIFLVRFQGKIWLSDPTWEWKGNDNHCHWSVEEMPNCTWLSCACGMKISCSAHLVAARVCQVTVVRIHWQGTMPCRSWTHRLRLNSLYGMFPFQSDSIINTVFIWLNTTLE